MGIGMSVYHRNSRRDLNIPERMWGIKIPRIPDGRGMEPAPYHDTGARVRIFPLSSEIAVILALSQFRRGGIK